MSDIFEYRKKAHESYSTKYVKIELKWSKIAFYLLSLIIFVGSVLTLPLIYLNYFHQGDKNGLLASFDEINSSVNAKISTLEKQYSLFSGEVKAATDPTIEVDDDKHDAEFMTYSNSDDLVVTNHAIRDEYNSLSSTKHKPNSNSPTKSGSTNESAAISQMIQSVEFDVENSLKEQDALTDHYSKREVSLENIPTIRPLLGGRITDIYGVRIDPFLKQRKHHGGLDIAAPTGTQVYAPAAGKVIYVRRNYVPNRGYGKCVKIDHGGGTVTLYGHLSKIHVEVGQEVKRWDVIGLVGDTGRSTGPHLHYEVSKNGKRIDPMTSFLY
ncbi:M23 family metallopeptidase [candidate division KSB1 bacterium]|nr:M23 family metallopeptidase [candidate division KSB1 bacterium]